MRVDYECGMCGAVYEVEHDELDDVVVVCWHCSNDVLCYPKKRGAKDAS